MYKYDNIDTQFLNQRVVQFSKQVDRYSKKELNDDQFRSVRLRNGLYEELHAYMLRVAIPYGSINAEQLQQLADIADKYDRGYGHFTTRQNIQFNWIQLSDITNILQDLADVGLHAIQTSGKAVRNITADPLSGVRDNEIADARPYSELIRQWFTLHPEFSWLPAKFKIAINGAELDEIGLKFHDLGLQVLRNNKDQLGFAVYAGGGLGAAPMIGAKIKDFVFEKDILSYLESVLRIYNLKSRRDNVKRARIKFLVKELGANKFSELVERDWQGSRVDKNLELNYARLEKFKSDFDLPIKSLQNGIIEDSLDFNFSIWKNNNVSENKVDGYSVISISLTQFGSTPGNIDSNQLRQLAKLALKYSSNEVRSTKGQDIVFPFVKNTDLFSLWQELVLFDLSSPHHATFAHIVACPGADYCSLAKAPSISVSQRIQERFSDNGLLFEIKGIDLHISGCENACAHNHVADIGLLGLNKGGVDYYQIALGGSTKQKTVLGKKIGRAISTEDIVDVIEKIVNVYLENRKHSEDFCAVFERIGVEKFKERVYV